jgi:ankyrin repeat protein
VCQLAELRKCFKLPNIRKKLNNLPKTLDATYERILKNIPDLYQRETKTILTLLSFSARPMSIQEVAEATAVSLETQCFTPEERFPDPYNLLEFCSSLVSLVSPGDAWSDWRREGIFRFSQPPADVQVLQFAHFSVKEYLLSDRTQKSIPCALRINEHLSHSHIAQTSLLYLLDFNNGKRVSQFDHKEFPFLEYSALHWTTHLSVMDPSDHHSIEPLILRLFDPMKEGNLLNYLNLYDPSRASACSKGYKELNIGPPRHNRQDFGPPIYYASLYGLLPVIQYLLSGDESTRPTKEALGSGVAAAASGGYPEIVALLLREGADPNSPCSGTFSSPLHAAASSGNPTIVTQLLDAGSFVNGYAGSDGSALHVAAQQGNPEVVQLLIDHGADLHVWSDTKGPPLCAALFANEHEVVATLLRNNIDVNIPPSGYFNPLSIACEKTGVETIRLLLEKGADVSLKRPRNAALHKAAERGDIAIMQLLLHNGADINEASCGTYGTALKGAIQSHEQPAFEFMLRAGADISFRGRTTMYPIDQAIFGGNLRAAERLIELGTTFSDEALAEALDWHTKEYLVKILLERGANPNAEHKK